MPAIDCDGNGAKTLTGGFTSTVGDNEATDGWFVDYIYYRLTKMVFYHDGSVTSGFEVFFEPHPADQFTDWPQLVHLYGSKDLGSGEEV